MNPFFESDNPRIEDRNTRFSNPRVAGSSPAAPTKQSNQSVTAQHSVKRPSLLKLILRDEIGRQLEKTPSTPLTREHDKAYQTLLDRIRRYKQAGLAFGKPLPFAVGAVVVAVVVLRIAPPIKHWRILKQHSDYSFTMQLVQDGAPRQPEVLYFCKDFRPRFEAGMTLTRFAYDHKGECLSGIHYDILRDSTANTCPIVPRNCQIADCTPGTKSHVICDGEPQFN